MNDRLNLGDMLAHSREAADLLGKTDAGGLSRNRMLQLALTRLVEIIGEAANRVSEPTRQRHPNILWPRIVGMRNRLVHGYDVIDYDLPWHTVVDDLPPLIRALEEIVEQE